MITKLRKGLSERFEVQGKEKYMWSRIFIEAFKYASFVSDSNFEELSPFLFKPKLSPHVRGAS